MAKPLSCAVIWCFAASALLFVAAAAHVHDAGDKNRTDIIEISPDVFKKVSKAT